MILPEIRPFDASQPVQNFLSGQQHQAAIARATEQENYLRGRQAAQDTRQNALDAQNTTIFNNALADRAQRLVDDQTARERADQAYKNKVVMDHLATNEAYQKTVKNMVLKIDPKMAETDPGLYQLQVFGVTDEIDNVLKGMGADENERAAVLAASHANGLFDPKIVAALRVKEGIDQAPVKDPVPTNSTEYNDLKSILGKEPTIEQLTSYKNKPAGVKWETVPVGDERVTYIVNPDGTKGAEVARGKAEKGQTINIDSGKQNMAVFEPILKELPKLRESAIGSAKAVKRVDAALDLVDKQGDSIVGISGAIKRGLAPYATAVGLNTQSMSDSQILDSLLSQGAGSLRMEVVGPGPVSNYENGILQSVSGKQMSAAEGVKKILEYQRQTHADNVQSYNDQVSAIAGEPGFERAKNIYKTIQVSPRSSSKSGLPADIQALVEKHGGK